jgi:hypothetical protein
MRLLTSLAALAAIAGAPAIAATSPGRFAHTDAKSANFETRDAGAYFSAMGGSELRLIQVADLDKPRSAPDAKDKCPQKKREEEAEKKRIGARPPQGPEPRYLAF